MSGLKIKVNTSRSDGNITGGGVEETNKLLKDVLKSLEKSNKQQIKQDKLSMSGLLGTGIIARILGPMAASLASIAMGIIAIKDWFGIDIPKSFPDTSIKNIIGPDYEKGTGQGGEDVVFEISKVNGEILDTLTIREAMQRGIVDKEGEIIKQQDGIFKYLGDLSETMGDRVKNIFNTNKKEEEIDLSTTNIAAYTHSIEELLRKKALRLAREEHVSTSEILALGKGPLSQVGYQTEIIKQQLNNSMNKASNDETNQVQQIREKFLTLTPYNPIFVDGLGGE